MEERNITPEESFSIIQQMINNSRERFANNGFSFLLWGILVIMGSFITYIALRTQHYSIINPTWYAIMVIGVAWTIIGIAKRDRRNKYRSQIDFVGQMLWMGFIISWCILVVFINRNYSFDPTPVILLMMALCTFVSGALMQYKPLYFGGIVFWIATIASSYFHSTESVLIVAIAMFLGYLIPGIMLRRKVRRERSQ